MLARLLGVDIGTTSVKVQAFSDRLQPLGFERIEYGSTIDGERFEQDPQAIWRCVIAAVRSLGTGLSLRGVTAIGVVGQAPTLVLVDGSGECLTPCLGWRDVRAHAEARDLDHNFPLAWRMRHLNADVPVSGSWPPRDCCGTRDISRRSLAPQASRSRSRTSSCCDSPAER